MRRSIQSDIELVHTYGAPNAKFNRFEPRGDNFYQDGGQKGPDLELTINGEKTYVDVSGIADSAMAHKSKFHAAKITVNQKKHNWYGLQARKATQRHDDRRKAH